MSLQVREQKGDGARRELSDHVESTYSTASSSDSAGGSVSVAAGKCAARRRAKTAVLDSTTRFGSDIRSRKNRAGA